MDKRQRSILTSVVLSLGLAGIQFLDNPLRFWAIGILGIVSIALFVWSLWEGLGLNLTLLVLILPFFFTIGVGFFWFLLPANIFTRLPIVMFYGLGVYSLCLTSNIYTVSAIRTIALLRAARGVGFVLAILTSFLVFNLILSLRLSPWFLFLALALASFPLFLEGFWSIVLEPRLNEPEFLQLAIISALSVGELGLALFFWPVSVVVGSLFLTVWVYMLLGLGQAKLEIRLFPRTVKEYVLVGMVVSIAMFFATRWG